MASLVVFRQELKVDATNNSGRYEVFLAIHGADLRFLNIVQGREARVVEKLPL